MACLKSDEYSVNQFLKFDKVCAGSGHLVRARGEHSGSLELVGDWILPQNFGKCSLLVHFPAEWLDFAPNVH